MTTLSLYLAKSRSILICLAMIFGFGQVGVVAVQAGTTQQRMSQPVQTEGISNLELKKYAQALIEIEPLRIAALDTVSKQMNGNLPNLMCHQPESMGGLSSDARKVFVNYCNQSQSIAQGYGLGIERFNEITNLVLSNPRLQGRLQRQVTCLQDRSC
jgi:Domain of unknown function (DUF4168)